MPVETSDHIVPHSNHMLQSKKGEESDCISLRNVISLYADAALNSGRSKGGSITKIDVCLLASCRTVLLPRRIDVIPGFGSSEESQTSIMRRRAGSAISNLATLDHTAVVAVLGPIMIDRRGWHCLQCRSTLQTGD